MYYVKRVQIRGVFWSVFSRIHPKYGKDGQEKTPYLDTFQAVMSNGKRSWFWYETAFFPPFFKSLMKIGIEQLIV